MNKKQVDQAKATHLRNVYRRIVRNRNRIIGLVKQILEDCVILKEVWCTVKVSRPNQWLTQNKMDVHFFRKMVALGGRGSDTIDSNLMRSLDVICSVHHKDRPKKKNRPKEKSLYFHAGKAREALAKQVEQMGGLERMSEREKESLLSQFGPLGEMLRKMQ